MSAILNQAWSLSKVEKVSPKYYSASCTAVRKEEWNLSFEIKPKG
jgi:hypothetical protein